jgi:hypothetical protein
VIRCADTGNYAVDNRNVSPGTRYKTSDVCQQDRCRDLPNIRGFAAHVWTGDDLQVGLTRYHLAIVTDAARRVLDLYKRMSAFNQLEDLILIYLRSYILVITRNLGESA